MDNFLEDLKEDYEAWLWKTLQFYTDKELKKLAKNTYQLVNDSNQVDSFIYDYHYDDYTWYDIEKYKHQLVNIIKDTLNEILKERGISL